MRNGHVAFYYDGVIHAQNSYPAQTIRAAQDAYFEHRAVSWTPPERCASCRTSRLCSTGTGSSFRRRRRRSSSCRASGRGWSGRLCRRSTSCCGMRRREGSPPRSTRPKVKYAQMLAPAVSLAHQLNIGRRIVASAGAPVAVTDTYPELVTTLAGRRAAQLLALSVGDRRRLAGSSTSGLRPTRHVRHRRAGRRPDRRRWAADRQRGALAFTAATSPFRTMRTTRRPTLPS